MRNFNQFLLLCSFLFSCVFVLAQAPGVITGNVTDMSGQPLAGASISVKEGGGALVDKDGVFRLSIAGNTDITITVSSTGYKPVTRIIRVSDIRQPLIFRLEDNSTGLDAVVVTATNTVRTNLQTPMSISQLNEAQMQKASFNSQADLLRNIPGITAEGGGGEVGANIFVRGLPSGGQYTFTPLQLDGMPVISTMGLNSSAPDIYFRTDAGIKSLEFARGGAATLHGMGSVAGMVNYTSKVGTNVQKTIIKTEFATPGKVKFDFNTGGPLNDNNVYYNFSGTYRYDNGPLVTGIPSNGYQFRGNIRKVMDNGSFTVYGQYIDDRVQYYSPYHLTSDRKRPKGWDGNTINTMVTSDVVDLTVKTPEGIYKSKSENGTYTKGGYLMTDFVHLFTGGWKLNAKLRVANYYHEFNFFNTDGSGRNPLSQSAFFNTAVNIPSSTNIKYAYANDNVTLDPSARLVENLIVDRIRPLNEAASSINITKTIKGAKVSHNITLGSFLARTTAKDYNVQMRYLSEFNNKPRLVNLTYTDNLGAAKSYTKNGVTSIPAYVNKSLTSNKVALFLTDEIVWDRFNLDMGVRAERQTGGNITEKRTTARNADGLNVNWGNGNYDRVTLNATDWAAAIGASYRVKRGFNVYANFSRGYFFPSYSGYNVTYVSGVPAYPEEKPERILQGEAGLKLSSRKISATLAFFNLELKNRLKVFYEYVGGVLTTSTRLTNSRSYGMELTYNWEIIRNVSLIGSTTYQKHKYTAYEEVPGNVNKWLERQPRLMINNELGYDNKKFDASVSFNQVGKRFGNPSNAVELDPYVLARMDAGYTFSMGTGSTIRVGFGVFNLFDQEGVTEGNPRAGDTQSNTGDFFVGRPMLPRSYFGRLILSF